MGKFLRKQIGWRFGAVLLLCAACTSQPVGLATVGQEIVNQQDVVYRIGIANAYGNLGMTDATALVSLVNDALEHEVARKAGAVVTKEELDDFSVGVDKHGKAPEVLKAVKQVFGNDLAAYQRIYLAPKILNRKLHDWFSRDAEIQARQRSSIEKAYALAQSGKSFEDVARAMSLTYAEQTYETGVRQAPDALKPYFSEGMAMMAPGFQGLLDALKPGETVKTIAEDDTSYRVVRLLEKREGRYKTAEIISRKRLFDGWYRQQVEDISIAIQDERLKTSLCSRYSQLYWLEKVCVR